MREVWGELRFGSNISSLLRPQIRVLLGKKLRFLKEHGKGLFLGEGEDEEKWGGII